MMHPKVAQAIQELDAAVMSGDTFHSAAARVELLGYLLRWSRELTELMSLNAEESNNGTD